MFATTLKRISAKKFLTPQSVRFMSTLPVIETIEGHKPPSKDDSVEGRYATVLFTCASKANSLHKIYEDMHTLSELYKNSEALRTLTQNSGLSVSEVSILNDALRDVGEIQDLTSRFIEVLAENKRLNNLAKVADKYQKLYQELNKEEKMTIYSARELSHDQKDQVLAALKENPDNADKHFIIDFEVDKTIRGGLVLYTETEYMDMSLTSRINRIRQEVNFLTS
ncbi:unnamed protein product [Moneuplotes crassus]|uniref:ATP synthase subunit 5, mitochondrial n=2 Tax=Euplotes crassus TaxID=5936 RepID=A0AAD2D4P3_EUPCR|nr:unnamed protein product [Moneuplotes crassus]